MIDPQFILDLNHELLIDNFAGGTHHAVLAASVIRHFGQSVGQGVEAPAPTVMGGGQGKTGLLAAHLTRFNTGAVGSDLDAPIPTILAGSHSLETHGGAASVHGVVAASVAAYYGSEADGQGMGEPMRTATTKARLGHVESLAVPCMSPEQEAGALAVATFLRAHGVEFEGEYATVAGYVIVDIGMRMLTPRELFLAQGFPPDYVIDKAWHIGPRGEIVEQTLTKEQQIRMCGNSVCPPVAEALVRANVPELILNRTEGKRRRRAGRALVAV